MEEIKLRNKSILELYLPGQANSKMECSICDVKYNYKSEIDRHLNSDKHKINAYSVMQANFENEKLEFIKKLEEANLEKENCKIKLLKEKRKRKEKEEKIKELETLIERQSRKSIDIENLKTNHGSSVPFYSNFTYVTSKIRDSSIESNTTEAQKANIVEIGDDITKKIKDKQTNLISNNIQTESLNNLLIKKPKIVEEYNSNCIEENKSIRNENEVSNEKISCDSNYITNDIEINNRPDYLEAIEKLCAKQSMENKFYFLDFHENDYFKTQNKTFFIMVRKKSTVYEKLFNYMIKLRKLEECVIKFYETCSFYFLSYRFENRKKVLFKNRFYFQDNKIDHSDIYVVKIHKSKVQDILKKFKSFESSVSDSITSDCMGKIFENGENASREQINSTEILLHESVKRLGIEFINEHSCSVSMIPTLLGFSKYNIKEGVKNGIYAFEKDMRVDGIDRKCDAIYIYNKTIFIIEYKNNVHHKQKSLVYIDDRNYIKHTVMYFLKYESNILEGIEEIGQIGIEFYKDKIDLKIGKNVNLEELKQEIGPVKNDKKIEKKKIKQRYEI
jgi:hypothetical protein